MKYNVGDKVRVRKDLRADWCKVYRMEDKSFGDTFVSGMAHLVGKVVTIKTADKKYRIEECGYNWTDEMFEPVTVQKIVITTDGVETLARLYDGKTVIKSATVKCSPDDFNTGAEIAFNRLMGVKEVKEEKKPQKDEPKFKVGDHVRLTEHNVLGFKVGDTGTIIEEDGTSIPYKVSRDGDGFVVWTNPCNLEKVNEKPFKFEVGKQYRHGDAVIEIEKVEKLPHDVRYRYKTVKGDTGCLPFFDEHSVFASDVKPYDPPKYYNGKVVCVEKGYEKSHPLTVFTVGKVYTVTDGIIIADGGYKTEKYKSLEGLCIGVGHKLIPFVE